jgi:hypothetical protein
VNKFNFNFKDETPKKRPNLPPLDLNSLGNRNSKRETVGQFPNLDRHNPSGKKNLVASRELPML